MPKGTKGFVKGHSVSIETKRKISRALKNQIFFNCDFCGRLASDKSSAYKRKIKHFCSQLCYSHYRKEKLQFNEQPAYRGVRKIGESRQIYHKNYCKNHPEVIAHLKSRRYARAKHAIGDHSFKEWNELKLKFNNKCANCGQSKKLTKDHIIPLSKGGTHYITNIQPLCRNCNSRKWTFITN